MPLARFLTAFSRKKTVSPKADAFVTPPQSGSGRKKQTRSKAAIRNCTQSFAQRVQYRFAGVDNAGSRGKPLALSWGFKGAILYGRE